MVRRAKMGVSPSPALMGKDQVGCEKHKQREETTQAPERSCRGQLCLVLEVLNLRARCRTQVPWSLLNLAS